VKPAVAVAGALLMMARPALAQSEGDSGNAYVVHLGIANEADVFAGLFELGLVRNRTDDVYGGPQISPVFNDALSIVGVGQVGTVNRTASLRGLGQIGIYNRAGAVDPGEAGTVDRVYAGLLQVGAYNRTKRTFVTALQLGGVNVDGGGFEGIAQLGLWNEVRNEPFYGAFQLGVVDAAKGFRGLLQVGAISMVGETPSQLFDGDDVTGNFYGGVQAGVVTYVSGDFAGVAQIGALGNYVNGRATGIQLAPINWAKTTRGLQIGFFNVTSDLGGVQVGIVNLSRRHGLPVSVLLNAGF
jgi:hypothetical protein